MTVRLRTHHLLCVLTYVGRGYSDAFVANLNAITERLGDGESVQIVEGPDEVCGPLLGERDVHCRADRVRQRDRAAASALAGVLHGPVVSGATFSLDAKRLTMLREAFVSGRVRAACEGCEWTDLCSAVADDGFPQVRLRPTP